MKRTNHAKTCKNERDNGRDCKARVSLKNWKGREEGEDPGKDGKRK